MRRREVGLRGTMMEERARSNQEARNKDHFASCPGSTREPVYVTVAMSKSGPYLHTARSSKAESVVEFRLCGSLGLLQSRLTPQSSDDTVSSAEQFDINN